MKTLTIQPSNSSDYRLFIDLAKRLKVDFLEQEVPTKKCFWQVQNEALKMLKNIEKEN